jgi:carbon storage regulator
MLVLSRKLGQTILINDDIQITVLSIRGSQVRIGIAAPASIVVLREELCEPARACMGSARSATGGTAGEQAMSRSTNQHRTREPRPAQR